MNIRLATIADADRIRAIYAPYCSTPISFETEAPSLGEIEKRMTAVLAHLPWLVCEQGDEVAGYAYAGKHRERAAYAWSVDVSVYVCLRHHRKGIGHALYVRLFEMLVRQGYVNAYAGVTLPNPASVGLHTSLGFTPVGVYEQVGFKDGKWHDVGWYQKLLQPRIGDPPLPRSLNDVFGRGGSAVSSIGPDA
jgi:L-amino acid N-acyltransferase YncA